MKISIVKKLDVETLRKEIKCFEYKNNEKPYMFASRDTLKSLVDQLTPFWATGASDIASLSGEDLIEFEGTRVYKNDNLAYGEVELR